MKYNLKNRPQVGWFDRNINAWFKGFEAELREMMKDGRISIRAFREILGE